MNLVAIDVGAKQQSVVVAHLFIEMEIETGYVRALALIRDRTDWITLPALIDSLLALTVVRNCERPVVEDPEVLPEQTRIERVGHQVAQVGDIVAIAAQQLVVAFAVVLLASRVAEKELCLVVEIEVAAQEAAVLRESGVGQSRAEDVGWKTKVTRDCSVVIESVGWSQCAYAAAVDVDKEALVAPPVTQQQVAAEAVRG